MPTPADREDRIAAAEAHVDLSAAASWYQQLLQTVTRMIDNALRQATGPRTITLWFVLDGGTSVLAITDYLEAPIDFPFVLTGVRVLSRTAGAIVLDVGRATSLTYPVFTSIVATAPPTLVTTSSSDDTLTGWTTQISATDVLAVSVTSNIGALTRVSVGLRGRVLGPAPRS